MRRSIQIERKRVLVSGASRGLSRTLAFAFAEAGATEVIAGNREEEHRNKLRTDAANFGVNFDSTRSSDINIGRIGQIGPIFF